MLLEVNIFSLCCLGVFHKYWDRSFSYLIFCRISIWIDRWATWTSTFDLLWIQIYCISRTWSILLFLRLLSRLRFWFRFWFACLLLLLLLDIIKCLLSSSFWLLTRKWLQSWLWSKWRFLLEDWFSDVRLLWLSFGS